VWVGAGNGAGDWSSDRVMQGIRETIPRDGWMLKKALFCYHFCEE